MQTIRPNTFAAAGTNRHGSTLPAHGPNATADQTATTSTPVSTAAAAAVLTGVLVVAVWSAVAFGPWAGKVEPWRFVPAAANVFGLMVCMAGLAACVSAGDSQRWRTVGVMCGFYVGAILAKLVGRLSGGFGWVGYLSVLNAYEPQRLVAGGPESWALLAWYDGILIGVGVVAYAVGAVIFSRRDLPAPL